MTTPAQELLQELAAARKRVEELEVHINSLRDDAPAAPRRKGHADGRCRHKTFFDHLAGRTSEDRAIWRCSECGTEDTWEEGWAYYGNYECRKCSEAEIERVYCPACSKGKGPFIG